MHLALSCREHKAVSELARCNIFVAARLGLRRGISGGWSSAEARANAGAPAVKVLVRKTHSDVARSWASISGIFCVILSVQSFMMGSNGRAVTIRCARRLRLVEYRVELKGLHHPEWSSSQGRGKVGFKESTQYVAQGNLMSNGNTSRFPMLSWGSGELMGRPCVPTHIQSLGVYEPDQSKILRPAMQRTPAINNGWTKAP